MRHERSLYRTVNMCPERNRSGHFRETEYTHKPPRPGAHKYTKCNRLSGLLACKAISPLTLKTNDNLAVKYVMVQRLLVREKMDACRTALCFVGVFTECVFARVFLQRLCVRCCSEPYTPDILGSCFYKLRECLLVRHAEIFWRDMNSIFS